MEEILQAIRDRANKDRDLISLIRQLIGDCPAGRIQVSTVKKHPRHYLINGNQRTYLGKDRSELAKTLMRKDYYIKLLEALEKELNTLEKFIESFDPRAPIRVYEDLHEERRRTVDPIVLPEKMFAEKWLEENKRAMKDQRNGYARPEEFLTLNGEYVRSKSEKILADAFFHHQIIYLYECPLRLGDRIIYPDFTLINLRTGKIYYWEHFGRMDDPEYVNDVVQKIRSYERSGIFPGEQLIISMETSKIPLSVKDIERLIEKYLL